MSGPKVVRIVTREEMIAICRRQLARLDVVVARWVKEGTRLRNLNDTEIAAAQRRRDQLVDLLEKDRFAEVQRAIAQEISFLRADQEERLNKAAAAAAQARSNARREEQAAKALLSALRRAGKPLPIELERALEEAARGMGSPATALSAGVALLSTPSATNAVHLKALADGLKEADRDRGFETWLRSQPPSADELLLSKVEGRISELAALAGSDSAAPYELRLVTLRRGEQSERHSMLLDSLMLDLSKALQRAREMTELHEKLTLALAELAALSPALAEKFASFDGETPETLQAHLNSVEATINAEQEAQAALARRRAVFEGLAALGYEVGAELDTAWVRDGRIVLRKPAQPGYGVEIGGGAHSERLQMRVVAFGDEAADTARDRDAETLWCGDVANLQSRFAASGARLTIERALPVGAKPVKRLSLSETRHRREAAARQAKGLG